MLLGIIKIKSFWLWITLLGIWRQAEHSYDKELESTVYKGLLELKKKTNPIKMYERCERTPRKYHRNHQ